MICDYNSFVDALLNAGFSIAGGNDEGVFGLINFDWKEEPPDSPIRWHTGDPDTDPWEWRMRVLDERNDIAYSKVFFKKAGFITKQWYPYFLAARRGGRDFVDEYIDGKFSNFAKRIYEVVAENGSLPLHEIKRITGFSREDKSKFDGALNELQMRMYLTVCGQQQKLSLKGVGYSWPSAVFCTTEHFFGEDVFIQAAKINEDEAVTEITEQVYRLNPAAQEKKIKKFIRG